MKAEERFDLLNSYWRAYGEDYYEWAQYYSGKELWNLLQDLLANGYEGVVITRGDAPYQPGKRPSKNCLKVKKELQETMKSINSIAGSADSQLQSTKASIATLIGTASCFGGKLKSFAQGIMKGVSFGLGLFKK